MAQGSQGTCPAELLPPSRKFALALLHQDEIYPNATFALARRKAAERIPQYRAFLLGLAQKAKCICVCSVLCGLLLLETRN
jgi:hypothetical protein